MKYNKNRRRFLSLYLAVSSAALLTGFSSLAEAKDLSAFIPTPAAHSEWDFSQIVEEIPTETVEMTKIAAQEAQAAYIKKQEEERKAAEEAQRLAEEQAALEAAAQADKELLAALIFCEAGNQPYEGQVAVGAVVMNRVNSGSYPNTISEVIYQSGQFTPAMTGWLDSVRARSGYTESAMRAAEDALAGSNPVGGCLYFSTGGGGYQIGDHFFR